MKTLEQGFDRAAERHCGPNDSKQITVKRYTLKDWFRHGYRKGFFSARRETSPATAKRLKKIAADRLIGMCKAADERDALRAQLEFVEGLIRLPHASFHFNDDETLTEVGGVPVGFTIRVDASCLPPVTVTAPTFAEAIDKARRQMEQEQKS